MFRALNMTSQRWAFAAPLLPGRALFPSTLSRHSPLAPVYRVAPRAISLVATAPGPRSGAKPARVPAIVRPMVPSRDLLQFVEDKAQPRSVVLKSLSKYVKDHELQDPNDRRIVLCDDKLKKLLGVEKCTILEMSKYITPHLSKPETVGGKYLEDAGKFEEEYLRVKAAEAAERLENGEPLKPVRGRKKRRVSKTNTEDKTKGRRLFKPVLLSPDLAAVCRKQEMPRHEIVKAVWEYIRLNNLQSKPGEPIKCDFLLRKVFDSDEIDVRAIMKGVAAHVKKIDT